MTNNIFALIVILNIILILKKRDEKLKITFCKKNAPETITHE